MEGHPDFDWNCNHFNHNVIWPMVFDYPDLREAVAGRWSLNEYNRTREVLFVNGTNLHLNPRQLS